MQGETVFTTEMGTNIKLKVNLLPVTFRYCRNVVNGCNFVNRRSRGLNHSANASTQFATRDRDNYATPLKASAAEGNAETGMKNPNQNLYQKERYHGVLLPVTLRYCRNIVNGCNFVNRRPRGLKHSANASMQFATNREGPYPASHRAAAAPAAEAVKLSLRGDIRDAAVLPNRGPINRH